MGRGEFQAAKYKRIGKGGKEVWIEASYNPIFDLNGKPYKVVKYATNITEQMEMIRNVQKLMTENLGQIEASVNQVKGQAAGASAASTETSQNVDAVASGAEELHASVQEISHGMSKSRTETDTAVDKVSIATQDTQRLAEAALAMSGIIELIRNIAEQVNLLSLNATIEAARAGDAGKGFAVVASEVKKLAAQTADATNKIGAEISGIQEVVDRVVDGLDGINTAIRAVQGYASGSAGAMEEQSAVARDMSSNMQSASQAVAEVSQSMAMIVASVDQVQAAVHTAMEAARELVK